MASLADTDAGMAWEDDMIILFISLSYPKMIGSVRACKRTFYRTARMLIGYMPSHLKGIFKAKCPVYFSVTWPRRYQHSVVHSGSIAVIISKQVLAVLLFHVIVSYLVIAASITAIL